MTGQAGKVDLQVGANDEQKLAVDLSPPGFSVEALGLEGLNIAGIDGEVTERNTLRGVARDIPLYYSNSFGYYTSDGSGGFSRVSVTATHNTETDSSQVSINTPRPIFSAALATEAVALPDLPANQRLIQQDDTYYLEERLAETMEMGTLPDGSSGLVRTYPVEATIETGTYTDISDAFTFGGENYSLAGAGSVSYLSSSGDALSSAELTEDSSGDLYIRAEIDGEERFFQLNSVTATGDTPEQLVLQADFQGFAGINLSGLPTLTDPETPATDLSTLDASNITFNGDFTGLGSLAIVQREADG